MGVTKIMGENNNNSHYKGLGIIEIFADMEYIQVMT